MKTTAKIICFIAFGLYFGIAEGQETLPEYKYWGSFNGRFERDDTLTPLGVPIGNSGYYFEKKLGIYYGEKFPWIYSEVFGWCYKSDYNSDFLYILGSGLRINIPQIEFRGWYKLEVPRIVVLSEERFPNTYWSQRIYSVETSEWVDINLGWLEYSVQYIGPFN